MTIKTGLFVLLLIPVTVRAQVDSDSYISDCNKSQGLSYCQQQAQTLNGGESNTMKGLNDFMKLMQDRANARRYESSGPVPEKPLDGVAPMSPEQREELHVWQKEQAATGSRMVPAIKRDREESMLPVDWHWSKDGVNEASALVDKLKADAFNDDTSMDQVRAALVRVVEWNLNWKMPPRGCHCDITVYPPPNGRIENYEMISTSLLKKVIKAEKKYPGNAYALDAHFYLGKLYLYGIDKAAYTYYDKKWKDVKEDPDDGMEEFGAVLDYLRLEQKPNADGIVELTGKVNGQQHTVLPYQHPMIVLSVYELMRGYRDGIGVKKDPAKAQALARELLERLAPLHPDLSFFIANPLAERAEANKRGIFDNGSFESVKDIMEPALYAWAQAHPVTDKPGAEAAGQVVK